MRKALIGAMCSTGAALLALLVYSLERTAWLFGRFEREGAAAYAAALVVELAAVALIAGAGALAHVQPAARGWANRALGVVLAVGALGNLSAGYLQGGRATLALFGRPDDAAAYAVAAVLWLVANLAVPALILALSKLLELELGALASVDAAPAAHQLVADAVETAHQLVADTVETVDTAPPATAALETAFIGQLPEAARMAAHQRRHTCKTCGAADLTFAELGQHGRRHKAAQQVA